MAHFAELDENNIVLRVLVVNNSDIINNNGEESEKIGEDFLKNLFGGISWKQTSYNKSFRKNFAAEGYYYSQELDAFIPPKPYQSWLLNQETCQWNPPSTPPDAGFWEWDENSARWIEQI